MKKILKKLIKLFGYDIKKINFVKKRQNDYDAFQDMTEILKDYSIKTIFDVGAYVGDLSLFYSSLFKEATIYSFEPFWASWNKLKDNTIHNKRIKHFNVAICDKVGTTYLHINNKDYTNSTFESEVTKSYLDKLIKTKEKITINTTTIEEIALKANINTIDILKIDIQGGELLALKGCEKMLQQGKIKLIYLEIEFNTIYKNQPLFHDIANYLYKLNYYLYNIYNLKFDDYGIIYWGDAIFINNELFNKLKHSHN